MSIKVWLSKCYARVVVGQNQRWHQDAINIQLRLLSHLVKQARNTQFGVDHQFSSIGSYQDFKKKVPIRDYEGFRPYVERILKGERDVLWQGMPLYLAKTSGTTSGVKYIPISRESMPEHIKAARNALLYYIHETGKADFVKGKMIFLQGSPKLEQKSGIKYGRLSGIVANHVPTYLQKNRLPTYATNCIEDWEEKLSAIVEETYSEDMTLISGIPPWVQMYFDKLIEKSGGKKVEEIFRNFSLFVYGGVNFEPYKSKIFESIGRDIDSIETYPASEGFIAYQSSQKDKSLLLSVNSGVFYEFVPIEEYSSDSPTRLSLEEVELGKNYVVLLTTNAGLWAYNIGDTVKFVSKNPYKIVVTGRVKHFISAFGEHVIGEEVEQALAAGLQQCGGQVTEFTVAPQVQPSEGGLPYHEWLVEFDELPKDMDLFTQVLDDTLRKKNIYYEDLIAGNILRKLKIVSLRKNTFIDYMRGEGKLGGQNKVPRLSNDRNIAERLIELQSGDRS